MIIQLCISHILTGLRLLIILKWNIIFDEITQSFPLWRIMLRPRFEFPYYFLFLHWFASIFSLEKGRERNKVFISQMYIGKCDFYLFESSTQHTVWNDIINYHPCTFMPFAIQDQMEVFNCIKYPWPVLKTTMPK